LKKRILIAVLVLLFTSSGIGFNFNTVHSAVRPGKYYSGDISIWFAIKDKYEVGNKYSLWKEQPNNIHCESICETDFSSSNPDVALVDSKGQLIAVSEGKATISIQATYVDIFDEKTYIGSLSRDILIGSNKSFSDVLFTSWYFDAVEWAIEKDITSGYPDLTFKPNNPVTEEEFLSFLIRSYLPDTIAKGEERWSDPFYAIAKANNYPISKSPSTKITRQAVAEIIVGTQGKNYTGNDAIQYMLATGLAKGKNGETIKGYSGKDTLTRAEAVQFIKNVKINSKSEKMSYRPKVPSSQKDLPNLPLLADNIVGKANAVLAKHAADINNAVSVYGFYGAYNGDQGSLFFTDADGQAIMSYRDASKDVKDGIVLVSMSRMMGRNEKVDQNKVNAVIAAMKAIGLPTDAKLAKAINDVLAADAVEATVANGNVVMELKGNGYGKAIIYIN